jgi:hypothetical protein
MKRRTFIGLLGASALSAPFMLMERNLGLAGASRATASTKKIPRRFKLPGDVLDVASVLDKNSKGAFMVGGPAIAAAAGVDLQYVNFLVDSKQFTQLKKELFAFGVKPVSTADMPSHFIRFTHEEKAYNVMNMEFQTYMELTTTGQENGLILFAHNYLVYSMSGGYVIDPYGALEAKSSGGKSYLIKPLRQPRTTVHAFDHYLAATFDRALLGVKPSPEYNQMEARVLQMEPAAGDAKEIFARILDYSSDVLEVAGMEQASQLLTSPIGVAAAKAEAEIDLKKADAKLRQLQTKNGAVSGRDVMACLHLELKKKTAGRGAAQGLPEYVMANREQFRRVDTLLEAMETVEA